MNDITLVFNRMQGVAVHKDAIGGKARVAHRPSNRLTQRRRHTDLVDARSGNAAESYGTSDFCDRGGKYLAARRRELLGIVKSPDDGLSGKAERANG